jgi:hypothetical protein
MDEKIVLRIATKYGDYYDITESGNIIRLDQHGFKPSGQWKLRAIVMATGFRFSDPVVQFENIFDWLETKPALLFKNGNPRYTIADFDHGSNRVWGNTKSHGIAGIWDVRNENRTAA